MQTLQKLINSERGQTFVEYGMLIGFVSITLLAAFALFQIDISGITAALEDVIP